jgi:hypothetical protein
MEEKKHYPNHLGCCGYDEVAEKPATAQRASFSFQAKGIKITKKVDGPMQTRRISYMGSKASYPIVNKG